MNEVSPSLMKVWKEWNVRVTVLLSLTLQVVLIVLGNRRKHDSKLWIRIVTWCAYLSADFVATFALGVTANNMSYFCEKNGGSMDTNTELTVFWAPFLLMHLGGPDTITAYSLEDNELWLRHLLGLVVQMVMAIYVSVMAWTGSLLSFLSLLIFFAGLIKYGERTWMLRQASVEKIRESYADVDFSNLFSTLGDFENSVSHHLFKAYCLMDVCFQPLFLDVNLVLTVERVVEKLLGSSVEDTFQIIEISLAFMYNNLYTKAVLLYTLGGLGLRVITIILTSSVSVLFPLLIHKNKFSKIDLTITFILLFGAIFLEIYSALLQLFSDRFQVWLIKHRKCSMFEAFKGVLQKQKRWSNKMSQLSLLSLIIKEKPLPCQNFLKCFSIIDKLEKYWYALDIEISNDLKTLIFRYLEDRCQPFISPNVRIPFTRINFIEELDKSILAWHVATENWYEMDREIVKGKGHNIELHCELICQISRYMFSLLVLHPSMVSSANTTRFTLQAILVTSRGSSFASTITLCQKLTELLQRTSYSTLALHNNSISRFVTEDLPELFGELGRKPWEERWMIISCTWLEMLPYAACKCRAMQHAQRLKCGGEFLTHVWLLTKRFGLEEKDFKSHLESDFNYLTKLLYGT